MKKISPNTYAEAFVVALSGKHDHKDLVERFVESIRKHNDWSRRHQILTACEKKWRRVQGKSLITIESARKLSSEQYTRLTKHFKDKKNDIENKINPSLIAGVKILINDEKQFDGSLRRKMDTMFSLN